MAIQNALRWVVLGGVFALPFIVFLVAYSLFFPYITGKNFAFRIIVEIITGAWLGLALLNSEYRPKRTWLLGAFALFTIIVALADAFGQYPFKSFWSNYERMDGWVTLAHLFSYFVVASSVLNTEKLWKRLWQTSLGVSTVVGLYAFLQLLGVSALGQGGAAGLSARLDATFGNPIYLAAYMLFHIFIAVHLFVQERQENGSRWTPLAIFYASTLVLDTLILFFTGTRGTMLGLIGGTVLGVFLYGLSVRSSAVWKWVGISFATLVVLGSGIWLLRDTAFVKNVGFLQRLTTISIEDNTTKARFYNWGMAWQGVKERPILGWGQENYALVFDKYYDPRMYAQEQWFDRVHNIIFDWLVAAGFLGLFSYLSILVCAVMLLWRGAFGTADRAIFTGLLAAYFFHNLFVFDNITSYILFATVLAYIAYRGGAGSATLLPNFRVSVKAAPIIAGAALVLVWGAAWLINAKGLSANRALLQAIAPQQAGLTQNLEYFKKAISYGSFGSQEIREQLVQGAAQLSQTDGVSNEMKQAFFSLAASEMALQAKESPLDARFPLFLGVLLNTYGDYASASAPLAEALRLSPTKQTILYEVASNHLALGRTTEALAAFKQAFELEPANGEARIYYASALIRANQLALADEILAPVLASGDAADPRIAAAYVAIDRYDKIALIWEARVKAKPDDAQGYFTLAAAYYGVGNSARAIAILEELGRLIPGAKAQADSLIVEIRNGTAQLK